ncbi:uncharacterized protein METZ01_LOCUS72890, partial [marine metagenome]
VGLGNTDSRDGEDGSLKGSRKVKSLLAIET